jgi:hypothetical protein
MCCNYFFLLISFFFFWFKPKENCQVANKFQKFNLDTISIVYIRCYDEKPSNDNIDNPFIDVICNAKDFEKISIDSILSNPLGYLYSKTDVFIYDNNTIIDFFYYNKSLDSSGIKGYPIPLKQSKIKNKKGHYYKQEKFRAIVYSTVIPVSELNKQIHLGLTYNFKQEKIRVMIINGILE